MRQATQAEYVAEGGSYCPNCKSKNINTIDPTAVMRDGQHAWQQVECHDCGMQWQENFVLSGYSNLEK